MLVFCIGLPIVTFSAVFSCFIVDQIVVSVGPYTFHTFPILVSWSFIPSFTASPPISMLMCSLFVQPASVNNCQVEGVPCMWAVSYTHLRAHETGRISYAVFCLKK